MLRRISCAVVVCVLCQCSTASALLFPISGKFDPVADLSASGDWFAARESPVYLPIGGFWLNGSGHYFFAGETADLNAFLERASLAAESEHLTSMYQQVSRHLVIHPGATYVQDHLTKTHAGRAQWKLELLPSSDRGLRSLTVNVHVWIDDKIRLEDLDVPETFSVASGGEIERFVRDNSPEPAP